MNTHRFASSLSALAAAAALLAGCASAPTVTPALQQARAAVRDAQSDPGALKYASLEVKKASDSLRRAEELSAKRESPADIDSAAYVAATQARTAMALAKAQTDEDAIKAAEAERERARADAAAARASNAQAQAANASADANAARAQASAAQADAAALVERAPLTLALPLDELRAPAAPSDPGLEHRIAVVDRVRGHAGTQPLVPVVAAPGLQPAERLDDLLRVRHGRAPAQ